MLTALETTKNNMTDLVHIRHSCFMGQKATVCMKELSFLLPFHMLLKMPFSLAFRSEAAFFPQEAVSQDLMQHLFRAALSGDISKQK